MITLQNKERKTFYGTYYLEIAGRRTDDKLYDVQFGKSSNGKTVSNKQPHSFSIPPLSEAEVHEVALHLPQVKAALKSGWLAKVEFPSASAEVKKPSLLVEAKKKEK